MGTPELPWAVPGAPMAAINPKLATPTPSRPLPQEPFVLGPYPHFMTTPRERHSQAGTRQGWGVLGGRWDLTRGPEGSGATPSPQCLPEREVTRSGRGLAKHGYLKSCARLGPAGGERGPSLHEGKRGWGGAESWGGG